MNKFFLANADTALNSLDPLGLDPGKIGWKVGGHFKKEGTYVYLWLIHDVIYQELNIVICQEIWKTQQWPQDWKRSVFIPIPKTDNAKEGSNYLTIALISHASQVMFKILKARLQQYINCELPDVKAGFRKVRGTRNHISIFVGSSIKQ